MNIASAISPDQAERFAIKFRYHFGYSFRYRFIYTFSLKYGDSAEQSNAIYQSLYNELEKEGRTPTQQDLFDRISGQNLGDLLMKDWLERKLTPEEESFMARWESEQVVRVAALGIYCNQGDGAAPIKKLYNLLTNP